MSSSLYLTPKLHLLLAQFKDEEKRVRKMNLLKSSVLIHARVQSHTEVPGYRALAFLLLRE